MPKLLFYGGVTRMNYELIKKNEIKGESELVNGNLETDRLKLLPLQLHNLELSLKDYGKMQTDLGLSVTSIILDEEMQYAMKVRLGKVFEDPLNYLWLTNWAIVHKQENQIIGFIILKGYPNEFGEVIIGYDIDERHRRNGYATESLKGLIRWIFKDPKALCVIADIEKGNIPSQRLFEKLGAIKYKEDDELTWWKVEK
jgi:[ribosomal protein S5]-alanine N-acetyltransferase